MRIERKSSTQFCCYQISNVSFSQLIAPAIENPRSTRVCQLPTNDVPPLAQLCRSTIRRHLRKVVSQNHPIQMQFESVLAKDKNNEQVKYDHVAILIVYFKENDEEQDAGRIGTLYVMHEHERQQPAQRQEQNAEEERDEGLFENPVQANEADETPDEIRDLLHTPPPHENAEEEHHPHDDFEVWSPQRREQREVEQAMPLANEPQQVVEPEQIPLEDGVDAEAAVLQGANRPNEEGDGNEERDVPLQQFDVHLNRNQQNANVMVQQLHRQRRQRLHVNLVNGNRLIGFLNADSDDEDEDQEDLFREANNQPDVNEPVGLAEYDKNTV